MLLRSPQKKVRKMRGGNCSLRAKCIILQNIASCFQSKLFQSKVSSVRSFFRFLVLSARCEEWWIEHHWRGTGPTLLRFGILRYRPRLLKFATFVYKLYNNIEWIWRSKLLLEVFHSVSSIHRERRTWRRLYIRDFIHFSQDGEVITWTKVDQRKVEARAFRCLLFAFANLVLNGSNVMWIDVNHSHWNLQILVASNQLPVVWFHTQTPVGLYHQLKVKIHQVCTMIYLP